MSYWFNVSSGKVEDDDTRSRGENLLGPYATREEAAKALDLAAEKTRKWDDEDREWEERRG